MSEALRLAPLGAAHLRQAQALSIAVGWPHRLEDWRFLMELGEGLGAFEGERLVGTILWWRFEGFSTLGLVIVAPFRQGHGLGRQLLAAALERTAAQPVLLNATAAGLALYRRFGFAEIGRVRQVQGELRTRPTAPPGPAVRPAQPADLPVIDRLDSESTGGCRTPLIEALLRGGTGLVATVGGEAVGFAFRRRFGKGWAIGPLAASDETSAQALVAASLEVTAGFVRLDLAHDGLADWLLGHGLAEQPPVFTMRRGPALPGGPARTYALASQALG